jgi:hypothetical protein
MNYFINVHGGTFFLLNFLFMVLCTVLFIAIAIIISKLFKLPDYANGILAVLAVVLGFALGLFLPAHFLGSYNEGGTRDLYVVKTDSQPRLAVWLTKIYRKKVGMDVEQRLKTFDLLTGKPVGQIQMQPKHYSDDYQIYWLGGNKAWGHSRKTGIQLLDLAKPELFTEKDILKANPQLGESIQLYGGDYKFDITTMGLYVSSADGRLFRIGADMKATPVEGVPRYYTTREKKWLTQFEVGGMGKHLYMRGAALSPEKASLLDPLIVKELNPRVNADKVWVTHKSAIRGESDLLLSYIDAGGKELNQINLNQYLKDKAVNAIATYSMDNEILVFVGTGNTYGIAISGFTLTALRTDLKTGKILGSIEYLK